jgi:ribosomal protein L37E
MASIPMSGSRAKRGGTGRGGKKAGWAVKWTDELKIDKDGSATIQLTPAKYNVAGDVMPYFTAPMFQIQYQNKNGNTSWSWLRGTGDNNCVLQKLADSNHGAVKAPKYGDNNRFYVNVIHYSVFGRSPVERDGQVIRYSDGKLKGQPIYRWDEAKSIRDRKALLNKGDSEDVCFYRKKFLELPATQFKVIQEISRKARSMCKCGGTLFPSIFTCSKCEEILLNVEDTEKTDSEIAQFADQDTRCRHCGHVDFPVAQFDCDNCQDPKPHEYYEVVAKVKKIAGSNGFPTLVLDSVVPVGDFLLDNKSSVVNTEGKYGEDLDKLMTAQYDFEAYTEPKSAAEISEMLGLREGDIGFASNTKRYNNFRN